MSRSLFIYLAVFAVVALVAVSAYNFYYKSRVALEEPEPGYSATTTPTSTPALTPSPKESPAVSRESTRGDRNVVPAPRSTAPSGLEIMAWIYPGAPTCSAAREYADGRNITVLKPEYFTISENGDLTLLTEEYGCNGYSAKNVSDLKRYSKEQYATVSSSYAGSMDLFLDKTLESNAEINRLVSFAKDNGITGVEIDFEDFGGWNADSYSKYKEFITKLGNALHKEGKKLIVDGPATSNQTEENWFVWRYSDFVSLPVDRLVIMAYDYQYDQGVGEPISPVSWIENTINWTAGRFPNKSKLSVGIPAYGYKGVSDTQKFSLLTYEQMKKEPGFGTAVRDANSFEMTWNDGEYVYFYQDSQSIAKKLETIQKAGIKSVSIWHLGGNPWFASN